VEPRALERVAIAAISGGSPQHDGGFVTRGLVIGRIVRASGGQERTIAGLAGIGDLMLTCTGRESRNRRVGEEIGRGRSLQSVLSEMPEVAEGVRTCLAMPKIAQAGGVEAPIASAVVQVLYEGVPPKEAIERLMTRALKAEEPRDRYGEVSGKCRCQFQVSGVRREAG
jgi:glycerol-3-phosphate dehydrogenase (NAD(P)+)